MEIIVSAFDAMVAEDQDLSRTNPETKMVLSEMLEVKMEPADPKESSVLSFGSVSDDAVDRIGAGVKVKEWHTWPRNRHFKPVPELVAKFNCLASDLEVNHQTITEGLRDGHEQIPVKSLVNGENGTYNRDEDKNGGDHAFGQLSSSDSDDSQKSESNRLLLDEYIQKLNSMSIEEVHDRTRQWHCPAFHGGPGATRRHCPAFHGGPGATRRYNSLRPLLAHAIANQKTKVKLHRDLGEELRKWKTSGNVNRVDAEVVWPPMVVVMNTSFGKDANNHKVDLVKHFGAYSPVKARKCYDPQGRYGMNILIFESSADGYLQAKCLHKYFKAEEKGRVHYKHPSLATGLYGYLAVTEDIQIFNEIHRGKNKVKYELRSYGQMVKQMVMEKKQLRWLMFRVVQEQNRADALAHKLDMKAKEMEIVRKRSKLQHQENNEQLEFLERFFEDQINQARDLKIDKNILEMGQNNDILKE